MTAIMKALLFDCDGVLVDTEREGHRVAFNRAFMRKGYAIEWDVGLYGELLAVAGGKERMRHYFDRHGWPDDATDREELIRELHVLKTNLFREIIESGELSLRPGVARLIDEALADGVDIAICSTSADRAVTLIAERLLGPQRAARLKGIFAGDSVPRKKPDPAVYNLALQQLGHAPGECVVVEDSRNGFLAARAAGIPCVITTNGYTASEDFADAALVVPELGDAPNIKVTLHDLKGLAA